MNWYNTGAFCYSFRDTPQYPLPLSRWQPRGKGFLFMITVTYCGEDYQCTKVYKGSDYIHLADSSGYIIATFSGISNFNGFSITGGTWTVPTDADSCFIAVVGDGGTLLKGSNTCSDISTALTTADTAKTTVDAAMPRSGGTFTGNAMHTVPIALGTPFVTEPFKTPAAAMSSLTQ